MKASTGDSSCIPLTVYTGYVHHFTFDNYSFVSQVGRQLLTMLDATKPMTLMSTVVFLVLVLPCLGVSLAFPDAVKPCPVMPGWQHLGEANHESILPSMRIGLHQRNLDELKMKFEEISNPLHPAYGQHLSIHELRELIAAPSHHVDKVFEWVQTHVRNVPDVSVRVSTTRDFIILENAPAHGMVKLIVVMAIALSISSDCVLCLSNVLL